MTMYDVERLSNKLKKIAMGACFLGSGGGGGLETSFKYIKGYLDKCSEGNDIQDLQITDLKEGMDKKCGIVVAYMGAPQKMGDIKCPDAVIAGIDKFKKDKRVDHIDYIIPAEIGPVSTITACLTAHKMGVPVLNLDGAGRAVPTLDLITYTTNAKASVNPTILCSENTVKDGAPVYHQITLEISDDKEAGAASKMESLARPVLNMAEFDQRAGLVMWYFDDVTKLNAPNASVKGTLTFCEKLGGIIQNGVSESSDIVNVFDGKIYPAENCPAIQEICRGTLVSATTSTAGGFDVGIITIKDDPDKLYKIIFQNESLILWNSSSAEPLIIAPDLISYLIDDSQTLRYMPYTNGDIMENGKLKKSLENKEIVVYGIAAPAALKESESNMMIKRNEILRNTIAGAEPNALPKQYMSVLNTLGYYGKYEPMKKKTSRWTKVNAPKIARSLVTPPVTLEPITPLVTLERSDRVHRHLVTSHSLSSRT